MHHSKGFLAAGLLLLTACGSDPGSGTQTLWVDADLRSDGSSTGTRAVIHVRGGGSSGAILHTSVVELINDNGVKTVVPFQGFVSGQFVVGQFQASEFNWTPGFRLRVSSGNDNLEAFVSGPGLTAIQAPTANSTFSKASAQPLTVRWRDESGRTATNVEVEVDQANHTRATQDTGAYDVDFNVLVPANDERIFVRRWTEISLKGGTTGSTLRSTTLSEVRFIVQQ